MFIDNICGDEIYLENWKQIYEEYIFEVKDKDYAYYLKLEREVDNLTFKLNKIQLCVTTLEKYLNLYLLRGVDFKQEAQEVAEVLRKEVSFNAKFNLDDPKSYIKNLEMAVNRSKQFAIRLKDKKDEKDNLLPKGDGKKIEKSQFDRIIMSLSVFAKFYIDKNVVTVSEFVSIYLSMRESNKPTQDA